MFYPQTQGPDTNRHMVTVFGGYNQKPRISDGLRTNDRYGTPPVEWSDEENLSSALYPVLTPARGVTLVEQRTAGKGCLIVESGNVEHFFFVRNTDNHLMDGATDIGVSLPNASYEWVMMGAYLILHDQSSNELLYYNTTDPTDKGSVNWGLTFASGTVTGTLCDKDGTAYSGYTTSATPPANPSDGDTWLDTSEDVHVLKRYSAANGMWVSFPTVYIKLSATGIGTGFEIGDGVKLTGMNTTTATIRAQVKALNGSHVIQAKDAADDWIVIIGIVDQTFTTSAEIKIKRAAPLMDHICECNNRLWGCYYGIGDDGKFVNEVYCSKLGDFKNWEVYEGLSTDSWRASIGEPGPWTGAVNYDGNPIFFKARSIHKVYVSPSGAHQVTAHRYPGASEGSERTLQICNGVLYYLGIDGVYAYTGSMPVLVSDDLNPMYSGGYKSAAGVLGDFYYLSAGLYDIEARAGYRVNLVYDTKNRVWHKEETRNIGSYTVKHDNCLYYETVGTSKNVYATYPQRRKSAAMQEWYAESGVIGLNFEDNKYLSRFVFRMDLAQEAWCELYVQYDSDGVWRKMGRMQQPGLRSFIIPVQPVRCDHMKYKLVGSGDVKLYSICTTLEVGSDV